jgi:hypothetical protein
MPLIKYIALHVLGVVQYRDHLFPFSCHCFIGQDNDQVGMPLKGLVVEDLVRDREVI